jgi:hypothetical protein
MRQMRGKKGFRRCIMNQESKIRQGGVSAKLDKRFKVFGKGVELAGGKPFAKKDDLPGRRPGRSKMLGK